MNVFPHLFPEARVGVLRNTDGSWHTDTTLAKEVAGKLITALEMVWFIQWKREFCRNVSHMF